MTVDENDAILLVGDHLRAIEPPPGAKTRVSLQIEEQIAGRARAARPLWILGLTGVFVAGASLAAADRAHWFRAEPQAPAVPTVSEPTPAAPKPARRAAAPVSPEVSPAEKEPARSERRREPKAATGGERKKTVHTPASDTTLARQVAEFRAAMAFAEHDDQRALTELRAFKRRWTDSPLTHEADIEIVAALERLGHKDESRKAARQFVRSHPGSAKVDEMRALSEEPKAP